MHHIELYVSDLEASGRFWGWFLTELGYKEYQKWSSGISWKKDRFYLVIVQAKEQFLEPEYHRCRVGLNHLAFHAESKLQVDLMTEKLTAKGYRVCTETGILLPEETGIMQFIGRILTRLG